MARFYIATTLSRHAEHNVVRDLLQTAGHEITYDWTVHGSVKTEGAERLGEVGELELQGVRDADFVVVLLPGGRGTHAEVGAATILGKPTYIHTMDHGLFAFDSRTCAFYWTGTVFRSLAPLLAVFVHDVLENWAEVNSKTYFETPVPPNLAGLVDLPACDDCPVGGRDKHNSNDVPGKTCPRAPLCDWEIGEEMAELNK